MARRPRLQPAPEAGALAARRVHEVVRDYPEVLAHLKRMGIDAAQVGGRRLGRLEKTGGRSPLDELIAALSWRSDPFTPPSTGKTGSAPGDAMAGSDAMPPSPR